MLFVRLDSKTVLSRLCLGVAVAAALGWSGGGGVRAAAPAGTDLLFPLAASSAQIRFHEGQAANNAEVVDPALPTVPGPASTWLLTQWNHSVYLKPSDMITDPDYGGAALYYAVASDQETLLAMRTVAGEPGLVFTLGNSNGTLTNGGGRAFYLSEDTLPGVDASFSHDIVLSMDVRVAGAAVSYTTPMALASGAVLAMAYTGLGAMFTDPVTHAQQFVFMQVGLTQSNSLMVRPGFQCSGSTVTLYAPPVAANQQLPFLTDGGPLHHLTFDVTQAVALMLSTPKPCGVPTPAWTANMLNIANWSFTGIYFGSETENTDLRPGAVTNRPQGNAQLVLDVANLTIRRQ